MYQNDNNDIVVTMLFIKSWGFDLAKQRGLGLSIKIN